MFLSDFSFDKMHVKAGPVRLRWKLGSSVRSHHEAKLPLSPCLGRGGLLRKTH